MQAGVTVNAIVTQDRKHDGKWAASDVQLGMLRKGAGHQKGSPVPMNGGGYAMGVPIGNPVMGGGGGGKGMPQAYPLPTQQQFYPGQGSAMGGYVERIEGKVVQWNERGFGFIEFDDGRRAYVHATALGDSRTMGGGLTPGEAVSCVLEQDKANAGKWCAKEVLRGPTGEDGEICQWNVQGGFGFLNMDDGRRAYIHASVFGDHERRELAIGLRMRVATKPDPRNPGKWSVSAVKGELPLADEEGGFRPMTTTAAVQNEDQEVDESNLELLPGSVENWDKRGFGFVLLDDGRKAYVHVSSFGSGDLIIGERVHVRVVPDRRNAGKMCVKSMVRDEVATEAAAVEAALAPVEQECGGLGPAAKRPRI